MRRTCAPPASLSLLCLAGLAIAAGCGPSSPTPSALPTTPVATAEAPPTEATPTEATPVAAADEPGPQDPVVEAAPPPPPPPPVITAAQRAAFNKALKQGRALARKDKWAEAARQFEQALAAIPGDERGLSELSWAAFQTGDLARARPLAEQAVRAATAPNVRAASLYNLGRIDEARGAKDDAARAYQESLALRPNQTVSARLATLGTPVTAHWGLTPAVVEECQAPRARKDVCPCLVTAQSDGEADAPDDDGDGVPDPRVSCRETQTKLPAGVDAFIVRLAYGDTETEWYLVGKQTGGWSVIAQVGRAYTPGAFGIDESFAVGKIEVRQVGDRRVLWIATSADRSDHDMGINEVEFLDRDDVVLCPLPATAGGAITCPLTVRLKESYTRGILNDEPESNAGITHTPGLPIDDKTVLDVRIADSGTVTVVLTSGPRSSHLAVFLGEHKLF